MSLADRKRLPPALPVPHPGYEWVFDPNTFEPWQRPIDRTDRSDAGQDIKMIHTNIKGPDMPKDEYPSLRTTDDQSKAVQKTPHRVTLDSMLQRIVGEEMIHPDSIPHMSICVLMIDNGFALVGKSTPADPENYDPELGEKFAKEDALRQMWQLEAYLLREKMKA